MIPLFVDSLAEFSGRNMVCLCVGIKLKGMSRSVGFFKPLGVFPAHVGDVITDEDMVFFKDALDLDDDVDKLCPVVLSQDTINEILKGKNVKPYADKIRKAFKEVSRNREITIIVGIGYPRSGMLVGLPEIDFLKEIKGKMLLTDRLEWINRTIDRLLASKAAFGDSLAGVIFNRVDPKKQDYVKNVVAPYLKKQGIDVLGIIPEDPKLGALTVGEILSMLNGNLLCCDDKLDESVERYCIGAMNADAALRHFIKIRDKAVITGGDRADIMLAALDTPTKCIVLTGNLYPNDVVLSRAQQGGVPVIVVPSDTLETVEKFDSMMGRQSIREKGKLSHAVKVTDKHIDYDTLFSKLGL